MRQRANRRLDVLFLLIQCSLLVLILPLAHLSSPDLVWISGIYDDADQDNLIGALLTDGVAIHHAQRAAERDRVSSEFILPPRSSLASVFDRRTLRLRSPPPLTS